MPLVLLVAVAVTLVSIWPPRFNRNPADDSRGLPTLQLRNARSSTAIPAPVATKSAPAFGRVSNSSSAPVAGPLIRVALTVEPVRQLKIEISGPYEIRLVGENRVLHRGEQLAATSVGTTSRGIRIGDRDLAATRIEIVPRQSPAVWVESHQYRGTLRLYRRSGGSILAVNALPLEEYVASVIDSEMPTEFSREARKAQAVVARSYALYQMQAATPDALLDLYASTRSQKYLGYKYRDESGRLLAGESADSRQVAAETAGLACLYRGRIFCTYYSAVCGGRTLLGSTLFDDASPALKSVPCEWCQAARLYRWAADISDVAAETDLQKFLVQQGQSLGKLRSIRPLGDPSPDRIPQFEIRDDRRVIPLSGADLRLAFNARGVNSPRFTIKRQKSTWHLSGQGHGHGAGLCQWGARGQAQSGRTFRQILSHYYPGSTIATIDYQPTRQPGRL